MTNIAIVDYGMGNFHSVQRALAHVAPQANVRICNTVAAIEAADRIILPGQGAMVDCIRHLNESGLRVAVLKAARTKPLLGVCIGEQMLFESSQEGPTDCLGLFPGRIQRLQGPQFAESVVSSDAQQDGYREMSDTEKNACAMIPALNECVSNGHAFNEEKILLKIPHMGWNSVQQTQFHPLWQGIPNHTHFYFVHSFYAVTKETALIFGQTYYGFDFTSAVGADNIFAVQFHPEKSAAFGLRLYRNFIDWNP